MDSDVVGDGWCVVVVGGLFLLVGKLGVVWSDCVWWGNGVLVFCVVGEECGVVCVWGVCVLGYVVLVLVIEVWGLCLGGYVYVEFVWLVLLVLDWWVEGFVECIWFGEVYFWFVCVGDGGV